MYKIFCELRKKLPRPILAACALLFALCLFIWPLSFVHIYTVPNSRVIASEWIYQHIPPDKTIAVEHWDDELPIGGTISYTKLFLPIYEIEHPPIRFEIFSSLKKIDYIIIASNRLYVPLQKLTDCKKLSPHTCYIHAASYYRDLFSGKLGFEKIAEFTITPMIPFLNIPIDDQSADESFTVYDHPKIMIYQKK